MQLGITHRLIELIDMIKHAGIDFPEYLKDIRFLTPFAVEFRYDFLPEEQETPFKAKSARELIRRLRIWAVERIKP